MTELSESLCRVHAILLNARLIHASFAVLSPS